MKISIENTMTFQANEADMKLMFARENKARMNYSKNIRDKKDFKKDFYKDDDEQQI